MLPQLLKTEIGQMEKFNFASTTNNLFISLEYKRMNTLSLIKAISPRGKEENKN